MYIPVDILNKIQNMINKFILSGKKPCIKSAVLKLKTHQGGLAVPGICLYYEAAVLSAVMQWQSHSLGWHMEHVEGAISLRELVLAPCNNNLDTVNVNFRVFHIVWGKSNLRYLPSLFLFGMSTVPAS